MDKEKYKKIIENSEDIKIPSFVKSHFFDETMKRIKNVAYQRDEKEEKKYFRERIRENKYRISFGLAGACIVLALTIIIFRGKNNREIQERNQEMFSIIKLEEGAENQSDVYIYQEEKDETLYIWLE